MKQARLIDIIAPSSPPKNNRWKKGVKILQDWGFKVRFSPSALSPYSFHSNTNQKRALFLNQAFSSTDSSIVWMLRGGYGFQKLIPSFIKKYSKKASKKLFVGYSDGAVLHTYLNQKNQETLHAPTVSELSDLTKPELNCLKGILLGEKEKIVFKNLKLFNSSSRGVLKGAIRGGNLSLLSSSMGLPWLSSFKSGFLFLEDVNEESYKVDRMLHHLFYAGALKSIRAILFGNFNPLNKKSFLKVLQSFSQALSIPLIYNLPCGHSNRYPLPFNTPASLTCQNGNVCLTVSGVSIY